MDSIIRLLKVRSMETRRLVLTMGVIASSILLFQSSTLARRWILLSEFPSDRNPMGGFSSPIIAQDKEVPNLKNKFVHSSGLGTQVASADGFELGKVLKAVNEKELEEDNLVNEFELDEDKVLEGNIDLDQDVNMDDEMLDGEDADLIESSPVEASENRNNEMQKADLKVERPRSVEKFEQGQETLSPEVIQKKHLQKKVGSSHIASPTGNNMNVDVNSGSSAKSAGLVSPPPIFTAGNQSTVTSLIGKTSERLDDASPIKNGIITSSVIPPKKKKRSSSRPRTISEMNHILQRSRITFRLV